MITPLLELQINGVPQPQGSKRLVRGHGADRLIESNDRTLRPWRATIAGEARYAMEEADLSIRYPVRDALRVTLAFSFPRPAGHYRTGTRADELRPSAPAYKATRPDLDKLVRAVLDALTGIVFVDDGQVAELLAWKDFGPPGVSIIVEFADAFSEVGVEGNTAAA